MILLQEPKVYLIGQTTFNEKGMDDFLYDTGFSPSDADDPVEMMQTPIGKIKNLTMLETDSHLESEILSELAGRFCYRSFKKGRESREYLENVMAEKHGSVLAHVSFTFIIEGVSRALTHELIRHGVGTAVSQESQRYVNANDINFVVPPLILHLAKTDPTIINKFEEDCVQALENYEYWQNKLKQELEATDSIKEKTIIKKRANEAARAMLPNAAETRLVWTGNIRALRHICELRGTEHADLEIKRLAAALTKKLKAVAPLTFTDFEITNGSFGVDTVTCKYSKV